MDIVLHKATAEDLEIVKNLWPCYMHDMCEYTGWACGADGCYEGFEWITSYFSEPRKFAYVFRDGDEPAGFAMILNDNGEANVDYSITEFFIMRKFRRQGIGGRIANELFVRHPGRWKIEHFTANKPAVAFWRKVVERYARGVFEESSKTLPSGEVNVLRFTTGI